MFPKSKRARWSIINNERKVLHLIYMLLRNGRDWESGRAAAIGAIAVIKTIRLRPLPGEAFVNYIRTLRVRCGQECPRSDYIRTLCVRCGRGHPRSDYMPMPMPPMPPPPMPPMPSPFSSGSSAIMASVVSISPAIEAAFCRA